MSWALYHGERRYGVTLHKMEPKIDAGPIVAQAPFEIEDTDTALSLTLKCVKTGLPLIKLLRVAAESGAVIMDEQDLSHRHYYGKGVPEGGWLDWSQTARDIFNFTRACNYLPFRSPWGFTKTCQNGHEIGVISTRLLNQPTNSLPGTVGAAVGPVVQIACGNEWIGVETVFSEGKYRDAHEVLHPGERLEGNAGGLVLKGYGMHKRRIEDHNLRIPGSSPNE